MRPDGRTAIFDYAAGRTDGAPAAAAGAAKIEKQITSGRPPVQKKLAPDGRPSKKQIVELEFLEYHKLRYGLQGSSQKRNSKTKKNGPTDNFRVGGQTEIFIFGVSENVLWTSRINSTNFCF